MKCYTCYLRPDRHVVCDQGVSLSKGGRQGDAYVVRLGRNLFLSNECWLPLCDGGRAPDIHDGPNGSKVLYDVFPVETGVSEGLHCYKLAKPVRDDAGVAFVRFNMGGQVPEKCRADVWPVEGTAFPVAISTCAMERKPWPRFAVDGAWVVNIGDVFSYESNYVKGKLILTEGGLNEI